MLQLKTFKGGYDDNFSYILYDQETKDACIIDTALKPEILLPFIEEHKLTLNFAIIMHSHFDHLIGYDDYKEKNIPLAASDKFQNEANIKLKHNDELVLGSSKLRIMYTPGHLYDAICILTENKLFTSDTLFIDGCGRCDLEGADVEKMFDSLERIKKLPDDTVIYPGHDYGKIPFANLGDQKRTNQFLKLPKEDFISFRGE